MRLSKKIVPVIFLLVFGMVNTGKASEYYTYEQSSFTISVPKTWYKIPQQHLDAFAEQIRIQFRNNPSVNPDWAVYNCGFQKNSPGHGITPPAVMIRAEHNPKLARALNNDLNSMSEDRASLTYQQAAKLLSSKISQMIDSSVKNILFDKRKRMLRFSVDSSDGLNHVKNLTSVYISKDTIYHIMCTTLANIYSQDEKTFLHMSNSFQVTLWQQSHPSQGKNVTANIESKDTQEKLEKEYEKKEGYKRESFNILNFEGMNNVLQKAGELAESLTRQRMAREAEVQRGYEEETEKDEGVVQNTNKSFIRTRKIDSSTFTTYQRGDHIYKLLKDHPNYINIADSQKFKDYVNNLPWQQIRPATHIIESGTKEEIIQLISNYKAQEDYQESHRLLIKDVIDSYNVFDKSHAINILQDWINKEEDNAKVISLRMEDSSSSRYDQKYLVTYTISKGSNQNEYMYECNLNTNAVRRMVHMHNEDSIHIGKISKAHSDYKEIASDPKFIEYINSMPYLDQDTEEDDHIISMVIGMWDETITFTKHGYTLKSVSTYYPDMHFEKKITFIANHNITLYLTGGGPSIHLNKGEELHEQISGTWVVLAGELIYQIKETTIPSLLPKDSIASISVLNIDESKAILRLSNKQGFTSHRVPSSIVDDSRWQGDLKAYEGP